MRRPCFFSVILSSIAFATLLMRAHVRVRFIRISSVVVAALALLASTRSLRAQTLSGVVLLPDSATPAAGVIVVATDPRGGTAGRALTGARGQFLLRLSVAGRYGVTLLRIGFRPTQLPSILVDGDAAPP